MQYLDLFDRGYVSRTPETGIVTPSDLSYIRRLYQFNKDNIQTYYRERNFSVKNTHILSRLLEHFPVYLHYDTYRYLDFVNDRVKYLVKHFKFTSDIEKGIVHPPYFFGNDGEEVYISSYEMFDAVQTEKNWKTENVLTVLNHNKNDTKMLLPLGNDDMSRSGRATLIINIPKLAIKYREFVKEQNKKLYSDSEEIILSKNHFVMKYVLGLSIESITDHVFLNKIMDKFYERENVNPKFKHRFKIFEPDTQVERYVSNTLDIITNKKLDYVNLLRNIQLPYTLNAADLLGIEDLGVTRQVKWAIVLSRIDHMLFLFDIAKSKDMNKHYHNDWRKLATRLLSDRGYENMFSASTEAEIKEKLYKLSQL